MMKQILIILFFLGFLSGKCAAQVSLYNSRTLFDAFENPSQKVFYTDSSKQFAFNFFIPTLSLNASLSGSGMPALRTLLVDDVIDSRNLAIGKQKYSHLSSNTNIYLLSFKWFKRVKYQQEVGLSWQLRNDTWAKVSNETLAIFDSFDRFPDDTYQDIFNDRAYQQSYHQFGLSYRENYTKRVGLGVKLSYLSGIAYSSARVKNSDLAINRTANEYQLDFSGNFKSTSKSGEETASILLPGIKNPGLAITASANFKLKYGWFVMANVKDFGFIRWAKNAQIYNFSQSILIDNANLNDADDRLADALDESFVAGNLKKKAFYTPLNSKIEVLVNKNYNKYQPNLLISKNIFYPGGNVSLINNFVFKKHILSVTPSYNLLNFIDMGAQYLYKTPNTEFFLGSDRLLKTIELVRGLNKSDATLLKGQVSSGVYIGFSTKFGRVLEHPLNASHIPGLEPANLKKGIVEEKNTFFSRLLGRKNGRHKQPKQ